MFDANSATSVSWGDSVDPHPAYLPRSPVNTQAAKCRFREYFLCLRRQECLLRHYNWRNILVNPRFHRRNNDMDGLVPQ